MPPAGRAAPAGDTTPAAGSDNPSSGSAQELVAGYVRLHEHCPPAQVLGQLGREVRRLLDEGIAAHHIAAGLERLAARGLHPGTLPSAVNEAMNTRPRGTRTEYRGWANPADVQAAYGGDL